MSASVSSMKKWGIPGQRTKAPEITLLERLVWVRYMSNWWPALIYHSYTELQQHLYDQLDMVLKAQFAMAIMRQVQEKRNIRVARLLGRSILEVIEVEEDCYCEFYWQLPNVLPKACRLSRYNGNEQLFLDFHRALDQVEDIIREVGQENFALVPSSDQQTWLQRAKRVLSNGEDDASTVNFLNPLPANPSARSVGSRGGGQPSQARSTGSRRGGAPLPPPSQKSTPHPVTVEQSPSRSSTIATNDLGVWDTMMKTISNSFDSAIGANATPQRRPEEPPASPTPSALTQESAPSRTGRSRKSKTSATTDRVDNRATTKFSRKEKSTKKGHGKKETTKREKTAGKDSQEAARAFGKFPAPKKTSSQQSSQIMPDEPLPRETRDPPAPERTPFEAHAARRAGQKSPGSAASSTFTPPSLTKDPIQILPGLEGDDIMPGLSQKVEGAQDIWMGVLNTMATSRGHEGVTEGQEPQREQVPFPETVKPKEGDEAAVRQDITRALAAAEGAPQEGAELMVRDNTKRTLSFWQRLTCMGDV